MMHRETNRFCPATKFGRLGDSGRYRLIEQGQRRGRGCILATFRALNPIPYGSRVLLNPRAQGLRMGLGLGFRLRVL